MSDQRQWWYFTFGYGQKHSGHYVKFHGTYNEARCAMFEHYGDKWAFQYSEDAWLEAVNSGVARETELKEEV